MNKPKQWSRKYSKCIRCSTTEKKHKGNGMCENCYSKNKRKENPEKFRKLEKEAYKRSSKKRIRYAKKYYRENLEEVKECQKKWRKENIEKVRAYGRKYQKKSLEKRKAYQKNRLCTDSRFKLKCNISTIIGHRLRYRLLSKKGKSTFTFLPYTIEELMQHLEKLFTKRMTWQNYGEWHVDHKIPDCSFNYKSVDDEEFQKCWALKNLQPLWAIDNIRKSNKII